MRGSAMVWQVVHEERRRLVADLTGLGDDRWGQGVDVEGDGVDLLLALSGRPVPRANFSGAGAAGLAVCPAGKAGQR